MKLQIAIYIWNKSVSNVIGLYHNKEIEGRGVPPMGGLLVTNNLVTKILVTNNLVTNNLVTWQFGN